MKAIAGILFLFALLIVLAQSTVGALAEQPVIEIGVVSSFVPVHKRVPQQCVSEAIELSQVLARFPQPPQWQWLLVCDEAAWLSFLERSGRAGEEGVMASSDLSAHKTYVRGRTLYLAGGALARVRIDEVVAHELAHLRLNSAEEEKTVQLARRWLKDRPERPAKASGPAVRQGLTP